MLGCQLCPVVLKQQLVPCGLEVGEGGDDNGVIELMKEEAAGTVAANAGLVVWNYDTKHGLWSVQVAKEVLPCSMKSRAKGKSNGFLFELLLLVD